MVHRPFYLSPTKKRVFSKASQKSYFMWKDLASSNALTWNPRGTIEVALDEGQLDTLDQYRDWGFQNGMNETEFELLDSESVKKIEPKVRCAGAIFSKTDTCVDYGELTNFLFERATKNNVKFIHDSNVRKIHVNNGQNSIEFSSSGRNVNVSANFIVNAAGGGSIDIAHELDLGKEYTDLHFRGEYWKVDEPFASKISRCIYSVTRYKEFPFLDPHYIVRANGVREIGPNAVLVSSPWTYEGLSEKRFQFLVKLFEKPAGPKFKLFTNKTFLSLVWHEWRSSISKSAMCARVKEFIPTLEPAYLNQRGLAGVRSSVIDNQGFVPEAILLTGESSIHILNYNSPGATGAPAFSAYVIAQAIKGGYFDGLKKKSSIPKEQQFWRFEDASDL